MSTSYKKSLPHSNTRFEETFYAPGQPRTAIYILPNAFQPQCPTEATIQGLAYNGLTDEATATALYKELQDLEVRVNAKPGSRMKSLYRGSSIIAAKLCKEKGLTVTLCNSTRVFDDALTRDPQSIFREVIDRGTLTVDGSKVESDRTGAGDSKHNPHSIVTLFGSALETPIAERSRHGRDGDGYVSDAEIFGCGTRFDTEARGAAEFP